MSSGFVRKPDPNKLAREQLQASAQRIKALQAQLHSEQYSVEVLQCALDQLREDCPDCTDICELKARADDAYCCLLELKALEKNELRLQKNVNKFCRNQLEASLKDLRQLVCALIAKKEYELAVANLELCYCEARGAMECVQETSCDLLDVLCDRENLDPACRTLILKVLAHVDAS